MSILSVRWPQACVGCGNTNADELQRYDATENAEHTERMGNMKRTHKYSLPYTTYLCRECKSVGRSGRLKNWVIQVIIGIVLTYALFIYPITSGDWYLFRMGGSDLLWLVAIGYLIGGIACVGLLFGELLGAFAGPNQYFISVGLKASAHGATPKIKCKSNEFAHILSELNPSVTIESKS